MAKKFYICKHCGNIIGMIHNTGVAVKCCGENMHELVANSTDAAQEKHVPVVSIDGQNVNVTVGSAAHPMTEEHHIAWVYVQTKQGGQRKNLPVDGAPSVSFALTADDAAVAVYAYCNLHGLWVKEV